LENKDVTQFHKTDERFMRVALREAAKGVGHTSPNPAVGALLVRNGKIIGRGHHRGSGLPHAEVECLAQTSSAARSRSTMYVTLEPCSTAGRTGACTTRIIESGVKTVVIGGIDPNPRHNGRGVIALRKAGIEVRTGILAEECMALNEGFNKWIVRRRPFVIAKCGMTFDGRLTRSPNESRWITSAASRKHARSLREQVDAILVGAETVRRDDPQLTVRGRPGAHQPLIVVLSRSGKLPKNARIFREGTLIYGRRSLESVLIDLGKRDVTSVLIEGGGDILGQALDARLIDKVQVYLAPILSGGPVLAFPGSGAASTQDAIRLQRMSYRKIGDDICVSGYPMT
jgi:diaminohydroxyphosphoribosylaminopyrimidine deaminase / 5-amino-6-(5-phosphoribosylamino)uracil reductase